MAYLGRDIERRLDPRLSLEGAASVVVVSWPYPAPPSSGPSSKDGLRGRIAAYAAGEDYHRAMERRLGVLAESVARWSASPCAIQVDAGPLMEKDLAQRAGLGWFGYNTNILTKDQGSWLLLGALITQVQLPADPPFEQRHCGDCRACLPACPTSALDHGPTLDAKRCISYLTIELRGPIPRELRGRLGAWVFGCDICQEVCPWNDKVDYTADNDFLNPFLPELLSLSQEEFLQRYGSTAVSRARRRGLARNAAVALGNTGDAEAVPWLEETLFKHDEALVRAHAAWALGALGGVAARAALSRAAGRDVLPVRLEIEQALIECKS